MLPRIATHNHPQEQPPPSLLQAQEALRDDRNGHPRTVRAVSPSNATCQSCFIGGSANTLRSMAACNNAACLSISLSRCTRSLDYDFFRMSYWPTSPTETMSYGLVRTFQLSPSSILIQVPQQQPGLQAAMLLSTDSSSLKLLLPPQKEFLFPVVMAPMPFNAVNCFVRV